MPILTAKDMHIGDYADGNGRFCLLGHFYRCLSGKDSLEELDEVSMQYDAEPIFRKFATAIQSVAGRGVFIPEINDSNSKRKNARLWNEAIAVLGYTEVSYQ